MPKERNFAPNQLSRRLPRAQITAAASLIGPLRKRIIVVRHGSSNLAVPIVAAYSGKR